VSTAVVAVDRDNVIDGMLPLDAVMRRAHSGAGGAHLAPRPPDLFGGKRPLLALAVGVRGRDVLAPAGAEARSQLL
jgi:hypothetical protein